MFLSLDSYLLHVGHVLVEMWCTIYNISMLGVVFVMIMIVVGANIRVHNKQKGKMFEKQCKAQKWARAKKGLTSESPWHMLINKRRIEKSLKGEC